MRRKSSSESMIALCVEEEVEVHNADYHQEVFDSMYI